MNYIMLILFTLCLYSLIIFAGFATFFKNRSHIIKIDYNFFDKNELLNYKKIINADDKISFYRKICYLCVLLYIVFTAIAIYIIFVKKMNGFGFVLLLVGIIVLDRYTILRKKYTSIYKNNIISKVIKDKYPDLEYYFDEGVTREEYINADYFMGNNIDFKSSDLIIGNINNYKYRLSNVYTSYSNKEKNKNGSLPGFEGVFALVKLNKNVDCYIHVSDNSFTRNYNKVSIDNETFEKVYDVFSDNEILAMRILTPNITNEILNLRNKYHVHCEIKIDNDYIYFRFFVKELFGPFVFNKNKEALNIALSFKVIEGMQNIMGYLIKVIEEVDV